MSFSHRWFGTGTENQNATAEGGVCKVGAAGGDRTHDPRLRRPILYPLSYSRCDGYTRVAWRQADHSISRTGPEPGRIIARYNLRFFGASWRTKN